MTEEVSYRKLYRFHLLTACLMLSLPFMIGLYVYLHTDTSLWSLFLIFAVAIPLLALVSLWREKDSEEEVENVESNA